MKNTYELLSKLIGKKIVNCVRSKNGDEGILLTLDNEYQLEISFSAEEGEIMLYGHMFDARIHG